MKIKLSAYEASELLSFMNKERDREQALQRARIEETKIEAQVLKARKDMAPPPSIPRGVVGTFQEMEAELKEIERVLRVGGCIHEWGYDSLSNVVASVIRQLRDREKIIEEAGIKPGEGISDNGE